MIMKRLVVLLLLPSIFSSRTNKPPVNSKKRSLDQINSQTPQQSTPPRLSTSQTFSPLLNVCANEPRVDLFEYKKREEPDSTEAPSTVRRKFEPSFNDLRELCSTGRYHKIPLDEEFVLNQDPTDYLALAIQAHDSDAIAFSQPYVKIEDSSSYLQSTLIDLILSEDTVMLEQLGSTFPSIYSHIFVFYEPFAQLSGTFLIRIAVDQGKNKAAISMFKSVPVSVIGDFWQTIKSMKSFVLDAMVAREIRLKPNEGETGISPIILKDIFHTCVASGNLKALEYLYESTNIDLTTRFEEEKDDLTLIFTAMYLAAYAGYTGIVSYLGRMCPELYKIETNTGMLPAHAAASCGYADILKDIDDNATETLTAGIEVNGIKQTPFSVAIRNKKRNIADVILSFIDDPVEIEKEMANLATWALIDDNPSLLGIYFEYGLSRDGSTAGKSEYTLLEMAVLGTNDPEKMESKGCKIKCLELLTRLWRQLKFSFEVKHGNVRGSILGLVKPDDIDAYVALVTLGGINPNEPIIEYSTEADGTVTTRSTTFLNRIIAQGATDLVQIAIRHGADPRLVDDDGDEAIAVAELYKNDFALKYLKSL